MFEVYSIELYYEPVVLTICRKKTHEPIECIICWNIVDSLKNRFRNRVTRISSYMTSY